MERHHELVKGWNMAVPIVNADLTRDPGQPLEASHAQSVLNLAPWPLAGHALA
jgi:hypothetical protein